MHAVCVKEIRHQLAFYADSEASRQPARACVADRFGSGRASCKFDGELSAALIMSVTPFSQLTAAERAAALVDPGTLTVLPGDVASVVAARGRIAGRNTVLVLTDGRQRGGTIGLAEARQFSQALRIAERERRAVIVGWDTGGVRVQEGSAALAAASAVGVALAELALRCGPVVNLISGPRGCFGAPAVMAATGQATLMTSDALWGLTGPQLLDPSVQPAEPARAAMSAAARHQHAHATAVVADSSASIRSALAVLSAQTQPRIGARRVLAACLHTTATLMQQLPAADDPPPAPRRRDFFAYSFRRAWRPLGPSLRLGHVHAAWGELAGSPALGMIVGPERPHEGIGVRDAHAVLQAVRLAVETSGARPAPIITFLFCRGHALTLDEERAGLPRALAQCLRGLVAARLLGHPLLCVLGGGAYGAAYLTLAAPSHRVLAIRGTTVAPMAPRVLAAFQRLRGMRAAPDTPPDLVRMIPEIRIVESVVRLPRVLSEELAVARGVAAQRAPTRRFRTAQ